MSEHEHGPMVSIEISGQDGVMHPYQIHRGNQSVTAIKTVGGVPLADDLEQIVDGILKPLADDDHVTIKGGERFVSHVKDSGSS